MTPAKATGIGVSTVAVGGTSTTAAYHLTKETIGGKIGNKTIPENVTEAWTAKETSLKSAEESTLLTQQFKDLKTTLSTKTGSNGEDLKKLCLDSLKENYKTLLMFNGNDDLFKDIEKWCVYLNGEKLGDSNVIKEKTSAAWSSKHTALKTYSTTDSQDPKLTEELKIIAGKTENDPWKDLMNWCKGKYESPFLGSGNAEWKLIEKFCKKENS